MRGFNIYHVNGTTRAVRVSQSTLQDNASWDTHTNLVGSREQRDGHFTHPKKEAGQKGRQMQANRILQAMQERTEGHKRSGKPRAWAVTGNYSTLLVEVEFESGTSRAQHARIPASGLDVRTIIKSQINWRLARWSWECPELSVFIYEHFEGKGRPNTCKQAMRFLAGGSVEQKGDGQQQEKKLAACCPGGHGRPDSSLTCSCGLCSLQCSQSNLKINWDNENPTETFPAKCLWEYSG